MLDGHKHMGSVSWHRAPQWDFEAAKCRSHNQVYYSLVPVGVLVTGREVNRASVGAEVQFQQQSSCEAQFSCQLLPGFAFAHARAEHRVQSTGTCA